MECWILRNIIFQFPTCFCFIPSCWQDLHRWKNARTKTKIVYRLRKVKEKEKSRVCQKQRKKSIHKNIKTTAKRARMCMCDFIRPKMETYLFPAIRWPEIRVFSLSTFRYSSISCLSSLFHFCFVIISTKERAEEEKKNTKKMFEEFKWFKVFRDGRFRAGLKNLLMKFLEASKPERRKKKSLQWWRGEITTNQNHFQRILHNSWGCLHFLLPRSNISIIIRVILFNMLKKEHAKAKEMKKKCSVSGFSRARSRKKRKLKIYILNFIVFSFKERGLKKKKEGVENYSSKNENWWGEEKKNDEMQKPEALLVHPKIYFSASLLLLSRIFAFNSEVFWFAFNQIISWGCCGIRAMLSSRGNYSSQKRRESLITSLSLSLTLGRRWRLNKCNFSANMTNYGFLYSAQISIT